MSGFFGYRISLIMHILEDSSVNFSMFFFFFISMINCKEFACQ